MRDQPKNTALHLALAACLIPACAASSGDGDDGSSGEYGTSGGGGSTSEALTSTSSTSTSSSSTSSQSSGETSASPPDLPSPTSGETGGTTSEPPSDCPFPAETNYAGIGSFEVMSEAGGDACTILRPAALGEDGLRHPVILWGNGTTATPVIYNAVLRHWASHGFIVAAANTTDAGTGSEMLGCLDWVTAQSEDAASPYADAVDLEHVGASGHSQGGGGALMAGQDPRLTVTAPLEPYTEQGFGGFDQASMSNQAGPMFLMSGELDAIAPPIPNQQRVFDAANVPVFWGTLAGADHVASAIGGITGFRGPATAWFRHHLMCDDAAGALFYEPCTLCDSAEWAVQTANW